MRRPKKKPQRGAPYWGFHLRKEVAKYTRNITLPMIVYLTTGGSFALPIMNDATPKQIAAVKPTITKGSHVWI